MVFIVLYLTSEDESKIYPELQKRFKSSGLEGIIFLKQFISNGEPYFEVLNGSKPVYNPNKRSFSPKTMHEEIGRLLAFLQDYNK
jgi:hypothetical protein